MPLENDLMAALEEALKMLNRVCVEMHCMGLPVNTGKAIVMAVHPVCIQGVAPRSVHGEKAGQVEMAEEFEYHAG